MILAGEPNAVRGIGQAPWGEDPRVVDGGSADPTHPSRELRLGALICGVVVLTAFPSAFAKWNGQRTPAAEGGVDGSGTVPSASESDGGRGRTLDLEALTRASRVHR